MSRAGTPTHNPVNELLNAWIKEELFLNLIKLCIRYYNNEKPAYSLNYKIPIQYKFESGF